MLDYEYLNDSVSKEAFLQNWKNLKPDDPAFWAYIGEFYLEEKEFDKALPWLKKSFEFNSDVPDNVLRLASLYYQRGELDKAFLPRCARPKSFSAEELAD